MSKTKPPKPDLPRWIEYVRLDEVRENPANPKKHDEEQIHAAIKRFDFTAAAIIDERTGFLAAGHGRLKVLQTMHAGGDDAPPGITVDPSGMWRMPVQRGWASKNDDEAAAYLVADNLLPEAGGWDEEKLAAIAKTLDANNALLGTGLTEKDVEKLTQIAQTTVKVREVDTKAAPNVTFWVTVRGPLPAQPDVLDLLKAQLKGITGVEVQAGILTGKR